MYEARGNLVVESRLPFLWFTGCKFLLLKYNYKSFTIPLCETSRKHALCCYCLAMLYLWRGKEHEGKTIYLNGLLNEIANFKTSISLILLLIYLPKRC